MAAFADDLGTALNGTLQRTQAPLPPPPKGTFADGLAAFFGGGPDIEGAYSSGLDARTKSNSVSAQTLNALAEAEKRRQDAMRTSFGNDVIMKAQAAGAGYQGSFADSIPFATSANDYTNARLGDQEFGNRAILGDPNAAPTDAFAAGRGVQGRVMPQLYDVGGETVNMATDPSATFQTPAQQQNVAAAAALEDQRQRPPAAGGQFTLGGVRYGPDGQPVVDVGDVASNAARVAQAVSAARAPPAGTVGSKPLTEFQVKAMSQLSRMDRTEGLLGTSEFSNYVPSLPDVVKDKIPGVGNYAVSEPYQRYKQAAKEWISGLLRLDSGAAVPESEFKTYFETFFPQAGDGPDAVAQKRMGREAAAAALRAGMPQIAATIDASRPGAAPATPGQVPNGVAIRNTSKSGKPIVSHDGGKTWEYE